MLAFLSSSAPTPALAAAYLVPPGLEAYFLSLSRRPVIPDCGWSLEGVGVGPDTIRYRYAHSPTGAEAVVTLAHPSSCSRPVEGPAAAFCISLTSEAASHDPACGTPMLQAEIAAAIQGSDAGVRWLNSAELSSADVPPSASSPTSERPPMNWDRSPRGGFSLFILALAAFVAIHLRRLPWAWAGFAALPFACRAGIGVVLIASVFLGHQFYGDAELRMWVGASAFDAGGLLRGPLDPATLDGLGRTLLFHHVEPGIRVLLARAIGTVGLLFLFGFAYRQWRSSWLALAVVSVTALSPIFLRFANAEPVYMLALTLGLAAVHDATGWFDEPSMDRLWAFGTSALALGWLVLGPWALVAMPVLLAARWSVTPPERRRPSAPESRWPTVLVGSLLVCGTALGVVVASESTYVPDLEALDHRSVLGIVFGYHLVHPVLGVLAVLGIWSLGGFSGGRRWLAIGGVIAAVIFAVGGTLAPWSSLLVFSFVVLPVVLLTAAGTATAARMLPPSRLKRAGVFIVALALVVHYEWLFHGTFGRLLFS